MRRKGWSKVAKKEKHYKAEEFVANEGSVKFLFDQQLSWTRERLDKEISLVLWNYDEFKTPLSMKKGFDY